MKRRSGKHLPSILILIGSVLLIAALALAAWRQANPAWKQYTGSAEVRVITPSLSGEPEMCLTCHDGIEEIDEAHPVEAFGCVRCHGGDRLALDQAQAHAGMYGGGNPSDLSVVSQGCGGGDCHGGAEADQRDHIQRVSHSVQATYAGAVNRLLRDFNVPVPEDSHYGIIAAADTQVNHPDAVSMLLAFDAASFDNPSISAFGQKCQTCHLTAEPIQQPFYYRGTGCAACHVSYGLDGRYTGGDPTISHDATGHPSQHRMTTQIPYTTCNTCHNRGNYSLAQMSFLPRTDLDLASLPSDAEALRLATYYQPIGQFTQCEWELDCIDCHTSREVMGDGDIHLTQASAQSVQCQTCHGTLTKPPTIATISDPDDPAIRLANLNPHYDVQVGDQVVLAPDGTLMGWLQLQDGRLVQISQVTGTRYEVPPVMGSACQQQEDQQESRYCHECHTYNRN
jgi:hypothetical protein